MLTLAVDTATSAVQAALIEVTEHGMRRIAEEIVVNKHGHVENLTPMMGQLLTDAQLTPGDIDAVVAGVGPGPFTGLRVGMVSAATFAFAINKPVYGVCSLDGIGAQTTLLSLVATDARRKEIYWALYEDGNRLGEPDVCKPADLPDKARMAHIAVGEGAYLYREVLPVTVTPTGDTILYPDMESLVAGAATRILNGAPSEKLTPLYLRRPDAKTLADRGITVNIPGQS